MIKIAAGIGLALLLVATIAIAQPAPPGGPPNPPAYGGPGALGGPPGPGGPGGPGRMRMGPPPPPPSKGAQFRLGDGNRRIFIKCADDDSTKVCMDAIGPLLNKLLEFEIALDF